MWCAEEEKKMRAFPHGDLDVISEAHMKKNKQSSKKVEEKNTDRNRQYKKRPKIAFRLYLWKNK